MENIKVLTKRFFDNIAAKRAMKVNVNKLANKLALAIYKQDYPASRLTAIMLAGDLVSNLNSNDIVDVCNLAMSKHPSTRKQKISWNGKQVTLRDR